MTGPPRAGVVMIAALLAATVVSCAGEDPAEEPATLPPLPAATSAPDSASPATADNVTEDEKAVRAVYVDFLANRQRAESLPPARQRRAAARWLTDPELSKSLKSLAEHREQHLVGRGRIISDIMSITVDGATARLEDCMDRSGSYLVDSRTGRRIAGSTGDRDIWAISDFKKTDDGWRISATSSKYKSCVDR